MMPGGVPEPPHVRLLTPADAPVYRTLRVEGLCEMPPAFGSLPETEPDAAITATKLAAGGAHRFWGAFVGQKLVGVVRLSRPDAANESHRAELGGLYVQPSHRGCGVGRALMLAALTHATRTPGLRRVNLTVVTGQAAAIELYLSLGFRHYGTESEAFSRDGRFYDEDLMTWTVAASTDQRD